MEGILIQYNYSGDEAEWEKTINEFVNNVNSDSELSGKFQYSISKGADGIKRVHVGRWDSEATLKTLQQRDFFKTFSQAVQKMAGDSLQPTRIQEIIKTNK